MPRTRREGEKADERGGLCFEIRSVSLAFIASFMVSRFERKSNLYRRKLYALFFFFYQKFNSECSCLCKIECSPDMISLIHYTSVILISCVVSRIPDNTKRELIRELNSKTCFALKDRKFTPRKRCTRRTRLNDSYGLLINRSVSNKIRAFDEVHGRECLFETRRSFSNPLGLKHLTLTSERVKSVVTLKKHL